MMVKTKILLLGKINQKVNKTWLKESILTFLFFPPFGIIAVAYASWSKKMFSEGKELDGMVAALWAKQWVKWSLYAWLIGFTLFGVYIFIAGSAFIPILQAFY